MIVLAARWTALLYLCACLGTVITGKQSFLSGVSLEDSLMLSLWTGLTTLSAVLLALSLAVPLTAWVVPGMALVDSRFGFVSPWFAPPAIFNHGFMVDRVATVGNGFVLLALIHIFLSGRRILRDAGMPTDFFRVSEAKVL
jgi:hypothetical protein